MKKLKNILLAATILLSSCVVTKTTPSFDAHAIALEEVASLRTNQLYDKIILSTDKRYTPYEADYQAASQSIADVVSYDSTRKRATGILIIANDIKDRFTKYQNVHKTANFLNNTQLRSYKDYMQALFESLHNSEVNLTY